MERFSFNYSSAKNFSLYLSSTLILVLLFLAQSCKSPTAPKGNNPPDTTSSNFTFQTSTFGNTAAGSSYLNDVAIINDTDIWVVGAVYLTDSTGKPDPFPYNAVHWDGKSWNLLKITIQTKYGLVTMTLEGIFAFSSNDIWIVAGDPIHGDGKSWIDYDIRTITGDQSLDVSKGWGANSNSMYFVGQTGNIIQYNNGVWQKIDCGTITSIADI